MLQDLVFPNAAGLALKDRHVTGLNCDAEALARLLVGQSELRGRNKRKGDEGRAETLGRVDVRPKQAVGTISLNRSLLGQSAHPLAPANELRPFPKPIG